MLSLNPYPWKVIFHAIYLDIGNVMFIFSNSLFNLPAVQFAGFAESQGACDLVRDRGERLRSAMLIYKMFTP